MTALRFGPDKFDIPVHLMQKEREDCILVTDEDIVSFPWNGITKDKDGQYLLLDKCNLESIWTLSTTNRNRALDLVRKTALGIKKGGKKFADLSTGIFPLYRIYIKDKKDILILPEDAASILAVSLTRDDMDASSKDLTKKDTEFGYTLILEMAELLYYAAVGRFPYKDEEVRRSGYNEIPLEFYSTSLDNNTSSFITSTLSMKEKNQRKISGNYGPEKSLGWFIDSTESLMWNLDSRSEEEKEKEATKTENNEDFKKLWREKSRKAKRRKFWLEKGAVISVSILIAGFVFYFIGNWLYQTFKPPITRDLDQKGVIEHMYSCQNAINPTDLDSGFKGDVAQFNEVLNLYVTTTTRKAYEFVDAITDAPTWVENGKPSITKDTWIYGVIPLDIVETEENHFVATVEWYTPFAFDDESEEAYGEREGFTRTFIYEVTQEFDFKWNNRGWWVCTKNEISDYTLLSVEYTPFIEESLIISSPVLGANLYISIPLSSR